MSDESWGHGVFLTSNFDFEVDETGDLRGTSGFNEFEKDLAMRMAILLDPEIGKVIDKNTIKSVEVRSEAILENDARVDEIVSIDASPSEDDPDEIDVRIRIISFRGKEREFVIQV